MLLVMTATVEPGNVPSTKLVDCRVRLSQYLESLTYFIRETRVDKIVYCDNSNFAYDYADIKELAIEHNVRLEILKYRELSSLVLEKGKGYGEGLLMEYIFNHSKLLYTEEFFFKITGRLIVNNFEKIAGAMDKHKNYFFIGTLRRRMVDTRFYYIKRELYHKYIRKLYLDVDDNNFMYLEICFFRGLKRAGIPYFCFPYYPCIEGYSGTQGIKYKNKGFIYRIHCITARMGIHNMLMNYWMMYLLSTPGNQLKKLLYKRKAD